MKLATIHHEQRDKVVVALDECHLIDVQHLLGTVDASGASGARMDMLGLITAGEKAVADIACGLRSVGTQKRSVPVIHIDSVRWLPPVPRPGKICGVAMNNSASNSRKIRAPNHPAFFLKPSSCLIGHLQPIRIHDYYGSTHPEPELAVVIGRRAREIDVGDAMDVVFGYSIIDDVTSNGMRAEDLFHYYALYASKADPGKLERVEQHLSYAGRYKGSDTFGPMGPWLITRDEIPDPNDLDVTCRVAGEIVAEDSTRYFNYSVAQVISFISRFQTLEPGDVIAMGTAFKQSDSSRPSLHQANLARCAGPVEISITGLGTLVNPVQFITHAAVPEQRVDRR